MFTYLRRFFFSTIAHDRHRPGVVDKVNLRWGCRSLNLSMTMTVVVDRASPCLSGTDSLSTTTLAGHRTLVLVNLVVIDKLWLIYDGFILVSVD
jgi:hypothetical protein